LTSLKVEGEYFFLGVPKFRSLGVQEFRSLKVQNSETPVKLLHFDNEILAGAPECLRVGDAQHILSLCILIEHITA